MDQIQLLSSRRCRDYVELQRGSASSMALPYLTKMLKIEVDDNGETAVSGTYGRQSVETALACWLASPDGESLAPKRPTVGPVLSTIRRLRAH